jgi:hypothetical protein
MDGAIFREPMILECVDGEHILLANDPNECVRQIVRFLRDDHLHSTLAAKSRALAHERYRWKAIGRKLIETHLT